MKSPLIPAALSAALSIATPSLAATTLPAGIVKNIVLVHGAWADASSWNNVAHLLRAKGYHVTAVNIPLTSLGADTAATGEVLIRPEHGGGALEMVTQAGDGVADPPGRGDAGDGGRGARARCVGGRRDRRARFARDGLRREGGRARV